MSFLLVTDFDGCVCDRRDERIVYGVAATLRALHSRYGVLVVSSRATRRATAVASEALERAGLSALPFVHRDLRAFDDSPRSLVAAKIDAIQQQSQLTGCSPIIGIGDQSTDEEAYVACGLVSLRVFWTKKEGCGSTYRFDAGSRPLSDVWREIAKVVEEIAE